MQPDAGQIFEPHARDVYSWAYRLLGKHHDALDVVQDVFLKWSDQCRRRIPDQPRGWLRRVTLNRAIDLRRRVVQTTALNTIESVASRDEGLSPSDEAELREAAATAMQTLSEGQREALTAKVFDGLSFAAIAAETGQSVSTVKTHYLRAVLRLRDQLRPDWADALESRS